MSTKCLISKWNKSVNCLFHQLMNFSVQALELLVWETKQGLSSVVPQDYTGGTSVSLGPLLIGSRLQCTSSSAPPLSSFLRWKCIHVSSHRTQPKSNLEWVQSHGCSLPTYPQKWFYWRNSCVKIPIRPDVFTFFLILISEESRRKDRHFW